MTAKGDLAKAKFPFYNFFPRKILSKNILLVCVYK